MPIDANAEDSRSDEQLMMAYGRGEALAFEVLYHRNRRRLYAFIARALSPRNLVDDCFQDTWARIIKSRHRYQPTASFQTWMFQIAHNLVIDQLRRRPMLGGEEADDALRHAAVESPDSSPEIAQSQFQQRRRIQEALAALPADQRLALQLRWNEELSLEEIAEVTHSGRETVKSRLRYAMEKLRSRLFAEQSAAEGGSCDE